MTRTMYNQYVSKSSKQSSPPFLYRVLKKFEKHRHQAVEELIPKRIKLTCLEIGCGAGDFLFFAQKHFKLVVGLDVLPELTKIAKTLNFSIPAKFMPLDVSQEVLPFKMASFEVVISIATLQYVADLEKSFSEIYRVLKPGGIFIFEVSNFLVIWRRVQLFFGLFPSTSLYNEEWDGGVLHYFTESKLKKYCEKHGFIVMKVTSSGVFSNLREKWPSLLGANLIFVCKKPL